MDLINDDEFPISARDLHKKLEVKTKFADWIKIRIEQYSFSEGREYFLKTGNIIGAGRPSTDYMLSSNMAQHLCLLENNDIGKRVRQELLDTYNSRPKNFIDMMEMYGKTIIQNMRAQAEIQKRQTMIEAKVESLESAMSPESIDAKVKASLKRAEVNVFPKGCVKLDSIAERYFMGMNQAKVSLYLNHTNHPSAEYRYQGPGSEIITRRVWQADGLPDLMERLIDESEFLEPKSPGRKKNIQLTHPILERFYIPRAVWETRYSKQYPLPTISKNE
jgi:phage anti-repressor protein